jgi:hypothetical protein
MQEVRLGETKLREQQERAAQARASQAACDHPSHLAWKIVGAALLGLAATAVITSMHDIRRYVRIMRM